MLDFKELSKDGNDFELLVRELLFSMGLKVYWSGKGTDGGKDLLCVETPVSSIFSIEKRWLVQCKHNAHANKAVSTSDLDEIVDSCSQYEATGYLLVCSTYPSSKLVERLDGITRNTGNNISATYWDSVSLERMLSTPKTWTIAQRFFPKSANEVGWKIYATENPNRWVVNFQGYYFHLSNRIGSYAEIHLSSIKSRICDLESIKIPKKHKLRPRAVYYDDKNGVYTWYIEYMYPTGSKPKLSEYSIKKILGDGYALEDGQIYSFDIHVYDYQEISDHFDEDHYNYYQPYLEDFSWGGERKPRDKNYVGKRFFDPDADLDFVEDESDFSDGVFKQLVAQFEELSLINVIRSSNCKIEYLDQFSEPNNWNSVISNLNMEFDTLFSALIMFETSNENMLDKLIRSLPISIDTHFSISKRMIYLPGMDENLIPDEIYDLYISIHPGSIESKVHAREMFNDYFSELIIAIRKFTLKMN